MKLRHLSSFSLLFIYIVAAFCVVAGINLHMKRQALHYAEDLAASILNRNLALHAYMNTVLKPRVFAALEEKGSAPPFDPAWMSSTYALREIDKIFRPYAQEGYAYKECAVNARHPENEADDFERAFLARANADPTLRSLTEVRTISGRPFLVVLHRGEEMEDPCLRCHGAPGAAPSGLVKAYGSERGFGRRPGQIVSAHSIRIPLAAPYSEANDFSLRLSAVLIAMLVALYLVQGEIARRLIFLPLERLREKFELIASTPQRLGEQVPEPGGEELSALARAFNTLSAGLRRQMEHLEETVAVRTADLRRSNERLQADIVLRQAMEEALRASEERFRAIVDNAPMVLFAADRQARIFFVEGGGLEGAGVDRESLYGQSALERYGRLPLTGEGGVLFSAEEAIRAALAGRRVAGTAEIAGRHYDCRFLPLPRREGGAEGIMGLAFDITPRRRAEERLMESEARFRHLSEEFRALLDGIPDSLSLLSSEGRLIWVNKGTLALYRLASDPSGRTCRSTFCPASQDCFACPAVRALVSGRTESGRMSTPDGRTWGVKAFPLPERDGNERHVIRWASDITEQVKVQEDAMRASRLASLGELAAGVAHEINNPNGLILLNAALLRDVLTEAGPLLEEHFETRGDFALGGLSYRRLKVELPYILGETLDAAQRIRRIVEDLKNFARQEESDLSEGVDLNESVRTGLRLAGPVLSKATDRLCLELAEDLPPLTANAQRLEQVIVNLLMNACQALPERTRGIALVTRFDARRRRVLLEVRDEGRGMPPEILPFITDPFFTTRRESGGTGLGLAVSARIVKEHGGELTFESRPGAGTTVTLALPIAKETDAT